MPRRDHSLLESFATGRDFSPLPATPQRMPSEPPREAAPPQPGKSKRPPLRSLDQKREYRTLFRAAFDFFERNYPPRLSEEYWSTASEDLIETARRYNDDEFLAALLASLFSELETQYKIAAEAAAAGGEGAE